MKCTNNKPKEFFKATITISLVASIIYVEYLMLTEVEDFTECVFMSGTVMFIFLMGMAMLHGKYGLLKWVRGPL